MTGEVTGELVGELAVGAGMAWKKRVNSPGAGPDAGGWAGWETSARMDGGAERGVGSWVKTRVNSPAVSAAGTGDLGGAAAMEVLGAKAVGEVWLPGEAADVGAGAGGAGANSAERAAGGFADGLGSGSAGAKAPVLFRVEGSGLAGAKGAKAWALTAG